MDKNLIKRVAVTSIGFIGILATIVGVAWLIGMVKVEHFTVNPEVSRVYVQIWIGLFTMGFVYCVVGLMDLATWLWNKSKPFIR